MGGGGQTSTTKYELSPEQRQIMTAAMNQYMPGDQLPEHAPTFDYNNNAELQQTGANFVAPFSEPTRQAFAATEANYGAQQGTMNAGKGLTAQASGGAGQFQGAPDGWTTNANGEASYQDYETGIQRYQNPYTEQVINTGLGFLDTARQRANLDTTNNAIAAKSFGGTREAVRKNLNDTAFGAQAGKMISEGLDAGYKNAQGQYNTGFGQGQQALGYNTGVAQADRAAKLAAGGQLGDMALKNQQLVGNDINALGAVGGQIEQKDQAMRDMSRAAQLQDDTYGIQIAQSLAGMGAPPSSTTTQSGGGGGIWGQLGGGLLSGLGSLFMSDEGAKSHVEDADPDDALKEIRALRPKKFRYNALGKEAGAPRGQRTGFMAQDLEKATGKPAPRAAGGFKHVDMVEHIGRLTQAVQALDAKMGSKYGGKSRAA